MDNKLIEQFKSNTLQIEKLQEEISKAVAVQQAELQTYQQKDAELRQAIKDAMEASNTKKFENEFVTLTYVAPTQRTTFDSVKFKAENPEEYDKYTRTSEVKASVRIKLN